MDAGKVFGTLSGLDPTAGWQMSGFPTPAHLPSRQRPIMLEWIEFKNFKALRDTRLPLGRFTLIVGPNGTGKSTALGAVQFFNQFTLGNPAEKRTAGVPSDARVILSGQWGSDSNGLQLLLEWSPSSGERNSFRFCGKPDGRLREVFVRALKGARSFALDANEIGKPVELRPDIELAPNGGNLAGVLDRLRDQHPERFAALNAELGRWIPEFDQILFDTPDRGHRSIALRTREGGHKIKATDLSQGTLIALALLTIAYLPTPPSIVCLEEPDHGLHPRLLREVRDALYRLAFPEDSGEKREPVQVIATTHNPYFLDLFREHPEQIVIAEKVGLEGKFTRLSDRKDLEEILGDAPLSEVWYSGVLGGVPAGT